MKLLLILVLCFICFSGGGNAQTKPSVIPAFLNLLKDYPNVRDFTISDNGKEAYFSAQSPLGDLSVIMKIRKIDARWTSPEIASFSGKYLDLEPFLSDDGLSLYFASNRPLASTFGEAKDYDIWVVRRQNESQAWSDPINLGSPVNTQDNEFYPSLSRNNNLYYTSDRKDSKGKDDIFFSEWKNDSYSYPISLSDSINSTGYEFNAFIAPDESYLIFSGYNRDDGMGSGDLYISYSKKDNSWSKAQNMREINSAQMDYCPFINTSNLIMYFTSKRSNIETPENGFSSAKEFLDQLGSYENGMRRIYAVPIEVYLSTNK